VPRSSRDKRILIAVSPPLLGELLARRLDVEDVEVVLLDQYRRVGAADLHFDVVVTTGLPPARVEANAVLRLPDGLSEGTTCSLLTAGELERVRVHRPSDVVDLVRELVTRPRPGDE
jgi:hypothetical protein